MEQIPVCNHSKGKAFITFDPLHAPFYMDFDSLILEEYFSLFDCHPNSHKRVKVPIRYVPASYIQDDDQYYCTLSGTARYA